MKFFIFDQKKTTAQLMAQNCLMAI